MADDMRRADCEAADGLPHVWTRWDGKGRPSLRGEQISITARLSLVAKLAEIFLRLGARPAAIDMLRRRRGTDPRPGGRRRALKRTGPARMYRGRISLGRGHHGRAVADANASRHQGRRDRPGPRRLPLPELALHAGTLDEHGAPGIGRRPAGSALPKRTRSRAVRQAWCSIGRVSVSNGIWDKRGALRPAEWERVRLHPCYAERVLAQPPALRPVAVLAGMHHERRDGLGNHRPSLSAAQPITARVLAAADAHQAITEERADLPALSPKQAADQLNDDAHAGRLDPEAVGAVLSAAGHARPSRRGVWPAGLSDREVEVLRLVARGKSIAWRATSRSPSTTSPTNPCPAFPTRLGTFSGASTRAPTDVRHPKAHSLSPLRTNS